MLTVAHSAFTQRASLVTLQVAAEMILMVLMAATPVPQQFTPTAQFITLLQDSAALQKQEPP